MHTIRYAVHDMNGFFILTRDEAQKKLDELQSYGPHAIYSDEQIKINLLIHFIERDKYLVNQHNFLKLSERMRDKLNLQIKQIKDSAKKLDLIYERNLMNTDLRKRRNYIRKELRKLNFYCEQCLNIIRGTWKKEDLPRSMR